MFALIKINAFLLLLAEQAGHAAAAGGHGGAGGGFLDFYNRYLNYPGFEAWKFLNLFIFVGILVYLLRKPLSNAFKERRENIRRELIQAKQEKEAAEAKLSEVNARLARLDEETAQIREQSRREADAEAARIAEQTQTDVQKMRDNARREIESATAAAKQELRRFSANESIRLAEEMLRQNVKADDAARLVNFSINGLSAKTTNGGARQ